MEDDAVEAPQTFTAGADICQQLLTRYARSSAAQHRHLCATAAATRSVIQSASLPLTPVSYFAAAITSLSNSESLDDNALGAITTFISIVLPLVGKDEVKPDKAAEAVSVLVAIVEESGGKLGTSGVRSVVKCVGVLVAEFCNLEDWGSVASGFEWLLRFSLDKRPKVRKCAQDCLLKVFKSFGHSSASKKASQSIYLLLKNHMPSSVESSASKVVHGTGDESISRSEHQEVLHLLNIMKHVVPDLSPKIREKVLPKLLKIMSSQSMEASRVVFDVISAIFEISGTEVIISHAEDIFRLLVSYIALGEKNPVEGVFFAANLAKTALDRLHNGDIDQWEPFFPMLIESLAGLLSSPKDDVALQASLVFRELVDRHIDGKSLLTMASEEKWDDTTYNPEFKPVQIVCTTLYNLLCASSRVQNKHVLSVVSSLFLKLGKVSDIFMRPILLKLADLMNTTSVSDSEVKHLEDCIGSAVAVMGPEKILSLIPISLNAKDFSCSNIWLIPILKKNIAGSSLQFFIEHIVPLAESFEKGSRKVKKSVIGQDLQAYAHGCWGLLPAFCHWPSDTSQSFSSLTDILLPVLKKDSVIIENIAIGLQELVNENRRALATNHGGSVQLTEVQNVGSVNAAIDYETRYVYSRKTANKNIKALALGAKELLQPLADMLLEGPPETRKHLQGAISCLVSICDPSVTKNIFIGSLKKFQLQDDADELGKSEADASSKEKESVGTDAKRCSILDLAYCIVDGSDGDLVNILFSIIKHSMQSSDVVSQVEAYQTLSRILEKHSSFCSTEFDVVVDLLTGMKPSENIELVKSRFACLQTLLIHALTRNPDEENTKAFLILNEIILTLKDSSEEGRKAAYDALHGISTKLRSSTDASSNELYHKLISMITGYLSGPSPHIKSGVVSALSVLVYSDPNICATMPDIFSSVMELLHSKAIEVIKAVLGFVKVLVSCLTPIDLHRSLSEIMDGILRWSSVSRHHFKEKIIVILEILMRKCGCAKVKALAPDKYKEFVQGVAENRHGKASSKEAGNMDSKGQQKRKRDESTTSSKEEGPSTPWKKRDEKRNTSREGKWKRPRLGSDAKGFRSGEKQKGRSAFKSNERNFQNPAPRHSKHKSPARKELRAPRDSKHKSPARNKN